MDSLVEAIRMQQYPGIGFRGPEHDRQAWIIGTGLDIWEIVEAHQDSSHEHLISDGSLSERQVDLALTYYAEYPNEIDSAVTENRQPFEYWRKRYPRLKITVPG